MDQNGVLSALAEKYRSQGYEVKVRPAPDDLPDFARRAEVDVLATKGREVLLLRVNEGGEPADVVKATDVGREYVGSLILEGEQLLRLNTPRSALLMAWAAAEAAARDLLRQTGADAERLQPQLLFQELQKLGRISAAETAVLQHCMNLRNTVIHGLRPESIPPETIAFLIGLARRLVSTASAETSGTITISGTVAATVFRGRLNQAVGLKEKAERASAWLQDVLGNSRGLVSAEWNLAEDARERSVVTLTLSDFTGTVTTAFDPVELDNEAHVRFRLNRLWGNLLRIRSHKEIEGVLRTSGGITSNG